jgi:hypothetical protein
MTDEERAELDLLRLSTERCKFAVALGPPMAARDQQALERLQEREWIRLIDISTIAMGQFDQLFRIFLLTKPALAFLKRHAN